MAKAGKQMSKQPDRGLESLQLRILDAMIDRAEAACERYRQIAERKDMSAGRIERRRRTFWTMQAALARLRIKREAVASYGLLTEEGKRQPRAWNRRA